MAKKAVRIVMTLACTECRERNYTSTKNRRNDPGRIELLEKNTLVKIERPPTSRPFFSP